MSWVNNLCNCFSPQIRKSIIGYLSSSNLNRQVIQQQKCTEQIQDHNEQSIYEHVKQRSYYTIHAQDLQNIEKQKIQEQNQLQFENQLQPHWYPQSSSISYDEIYQHKLKALKHIINTQIDQQYQKVYDSQDQNCLIIYAKNQIQKGKRISVYRFSFNVPNSDQPSQPKDYLNLQTFNEQGKSFVECLLKQKQFIKKHKNNQKYVIEHIKKNQLFLNTILQQVKKQQLNNNQMKINQVKENKFIMMQYIQYVFLQKVLKMKNLLYIIEDIQIYVE